MEGCLMPFVMAKVNVPVSHDQELELKSRLGKAIEAVPGLNENYLLFGIEDNCRLYLRGKDTWKIAYIEASLFGRPVHTGFGVFAAEMTAAFQGVLGIPPENIYIKFDDIKTWSTNGQFIDSPYR